ncbi:hypothetical protein HPP92_024648 [Vanilla planifolia]|uniref:X8 domain-containing protein n=1 Tax=Vanilla planifolia TaxID=51239 RepID=A0A835PLQ5_VANPL|nr:hypothetical protein HPP92_024921 [Vanilla planifolia]KAG0456860.1 hypothetical protein HPP92_024648 [Vanilla planifolia]
MVAMVSVLLLLAICGGADAAWCICRTDVSNPALQKTLDYACGAGADCNPILQNGVCFNPNTVLAHCSYAVNNYYQRKGQAQGTCDFTGTATLSPTDPSSSGCNYPATPSAATTSSTGTATQNPAGSSTTPNGFTPTQSGTGVLGGLGPAGTTSIDGNGVGYLAIPLLGHLFLTILSFGLVLSRFI